MNKLFSVLLFTLPFLHRTNSISDEVLAVTAGGKRKKVHRNQVHAVTSNSELDFLFASHFDNTVAGIGGYTALAGRC